MNPLVGWTLAAAGTAIGTLRFGAQGLALSVSAIVFWLLLQFTMSLRALRAASQAPVGHVPNAVMLHAKLRQGMRLAQVIQLTRSLGRRTGEQPECWTWNDGSDAVELRFERGRLASWTLARGGAAAPPAPTA